MVSGLQRRGRSFVGRMAALWIGCLVAASSPAQTAQAPGVSRGALLYSTHCIACHSSQMHWRDNKLATDWTSLKAQVQRWQSAALLGWKEDDVAEVARHLNALYYHYPEQQAGLRREGALALSD